MKSQIKFPVHIAVDAQGPMGICDKTGKAVCWFSECFNPAKGYVWEPESKRSIDNDGPGGYTAYGERNRVVRQIYELIQQLNTKEAKRCARKSKSK